MSDLILPPSRYLLPFCGSKVKQCALKKTLKIELLAVNVVLTGLGQVLR
jgi:hypothetical protein